MAADGNLNAKSYFLNGNDTVLFETVELVLRNDSAFYVVHAADNALPISFASVELKEGLMAFENPKHDFPQRIRYEKRGADSLYAEVSGPYEGQEARQAFPMKKIR